MSNIKCNTAAIAAIVLALSLPAMSLAQAKENGEQTQVAAVALKRHAAKHKIFNTAPDPSRTGRPIYGVTPKAAPASPRLFTDPALNPDYHGSNGG
jgi:hypothetical protein